MRSLLWGHPELNYPVFKCGPDRDNWLCSLLVLTYVFTRGERRKRIEFWIVDQDSLDTRFCDYFAVPPDD